MHHSKHSTCVGGDDDDGGGGGVRMKAKRWRRPHRDYRVRNSVGKGGRCGRVKNIPARASCCVLTSPQVIQLRSLTWDLLSLAAKKVASLYSLIQLFKLMNSLIQYF